jgi:Ca-activated chloride channel family protein
VARSLIFKGKKLQIMKALFTLITAMLLLVSAGAKTITGTVTDINGQVVQYAQVLVKGTEIGSQTDKNGKYSIKANAGDTLVFSLVGYTKVEKKVGNNPVINVIMKVSQKELDEVMVMEDMEVAEKVFHSGVIRQPIRRMANHQTESYSEINENTFKSVNTSPLSTFSIDVDNAAYSNIRRMINMGQDIPKDAVKIEEMINYFSYEYPQPETDHPFSIHTETAQTPWNDETKLVKIGLQGKNVPVKDIPPSNLVFLIDVSGSMNAANKLPLLKSAFKLLTNQLREEDKVSIVVYAGAAGLVLEPTNGNNKKGKLRRLFRK